MVKQRTIRTLNRHLLFILILAGLVSVLLGTQMKAYETIWWWDDALHVFFGVALAFMGLLLLHIIRVGKRVQLAPWFTILFAFCLATMLLVMWEIFEFAVDYFTGATMQQWNMPYDYMMGHIYQGPGLRDTMSDMILGTIGAVVGAVAAHYVYQYEGLSFSQKIVRRIARLFSNKRR